MASSTPSAAGSLVITRAIRRKMARPSSRPMPSGQKRDGDADGDHGQDGAAGRSWRAIICVRVGSLAGADDLEQPVLGGQVVDRPSSDAAGDAAGQRPLVELAGDPEGRDDHARAATRWSCAGRASDPAGTTALLGRSRGRSAGRRSWASSCWSSSSALTPAGGTDPEPEADAPERRCRGDADERERRATCRPRRRRAGRGPVPPTTQPARRPPSPTRSRPRRPLSERSSTIHPGRFHRQARRRRRGGRTEARVRDGSDDGAKLPQRDGPTNPGTGAVRRRPGLRGVC